MPSNKNELDAFNLLTQSMNEPDSSEPVPSWKEWFTFSNCNRPGLLQRWNDFALRRLTGMDEDRDH